MCTFGRVASICLFYQCVLLVEVKLSTLKIHFVSLSAHCGNAENTFQHLWTHKFLKILGQPYLKHEGAVVFLIVLPENVFISVGRNMTPIYVISCIVALVLTSTVADVSVVA
jgi:hypothetical protein